MFDCGNIWLWYDIWYSIVITLWAQLKPQVGYSQNTKSIKPVSQ